MKTTYSHVVQFVEQDRSLTIFRLFEDGRMELYTSVKLPEGPVEERTADFDEFCRQIGENMIVDSPLARRLLGI